jgi:transcriptional regulator with XRE-family HTH domain
MSAFGTEVKRRLAAIGKDASWLAVQTKISHSTISNWFNNTKDVQPKPSTVARVAKALGCDPVELAPFAGYTIRYSKDDGERGERRAAILAARPRWEKRIEQLPLLEANEEDFLLSMIEHYIDTTLRRRQPPEESQ